jgi:pyrimidine operon attenuation protein/uracil phosphoribosyltransferase
MYLEVRVLKFLKHVKKIDTKSEILDIKYYTDDQSISNF